MATNPYAAGMTGTAVPTGGSTSWDLLTETAFDRGVEYYLRDEPLWRQVIDKTPERQAMPGDVVALTLHNALPLSTSPLNEFVDPDATQFPAPNRVLVTIQEWGQATITTLRLRQLAFTQPTQEAIELLGRAQADSLDTIVHAVADAGTNILWVNGGVVKTTGGSNASVVGGATGGDYLTRNPATIAVKLLQRAKVAPKQAGKYVAMIHPDVAFDLQAENSATAWNSPHTFGTDTANIYSGTVGDFQGARYIETTRTTISNTGASGANVYSTYYFGRQALVEVPVVSPGTVIGPQTDKLKRFFPVGWYAMAGWSIYRPQALVTVKTSSSIGGLASLT